MKSNNAAVAFISLAVTGPTASQMRRRRAVLTLPLYGVAALALAPFATWADSAYVRRVPIYVGIGPNNNGVASTNPRHMDNETCLFGYTIDYSSAVPKEQFVPAYVGVGPKNLAVISRDQDYNYDATQPIGMLALNATFPNAQQLYVGVGSKNNGVVTPNARHLDDNTTFFGWALPPDKQYCPLW